MKDIDWEAALMHPREVAINARLRLIQLKVLHRCYFDRKRLHLMGRATSPNCLRCGYEESTFMHTIWSCPKIQKYWELIRGELNLILDISIPMDPPYILLGIANDVDAPRPKLLFSNLGLIVAKRDIARLWGAGESPSLEEWKR